MKSYMKIKQADLNNTGKTFKVNKKNSRLIK